MQSNFLANLVITKVHSVTTMFTPEGTKSKRKPRERWALVVKYEGETVYTSMGKDFLSDGTHLVFLPKGSAYDWVCTKAGHFTILEFECDFSFDSPVIFNVKNNEKILKTLKIMENRRNIKKPMEDIESIKDVYSIFLSLSHNQSEQYLPTEKRQKIAPVIEYISQNYNKNLTNDLLASIMGTSTVYFRKLFTSVIGLSPIAYTHKLRIEKAKEMLKSDFGTLSDVALSLGYANLYDFSRDFKKHTGVCPSKF